MPAPGVVLGERRGPFFGRLTADVIRQYAEATKDPNPGALTGQAVPPVAIVTQIWEAQEVGYTDLVPDEVKDTMTSGVHGQHDIVLHRPIVLGEELRTWVEAQGSRRGGKHNLVTLRYATYGMDDAIVAEQWWTTVFLDANGEPGGDAAPEHAFPQEARRHHVADYYITADADMPHRYAEVSHDWLPHHFDDNEAQRNGFRRRFLHGLCTMGLCAQGIVLMVAHGDPERIRRMAVRFASPVYVGDELEVSLYQRQANSYVFEAEAGGATAIRNGLAELRA
jgi:acyl dehydratase